MITESHLTQMLEVIGFKPSDNVYIKHFEDTDCDVKVDLANKIIIYPENNGFTVNERQTCNFMANENFVVLECVCRLLEKGYHPEHIELEPKWKVGHGASGGRADIWVRTNNKDNSKQSLLIIECKTAGSEFSGAWSDTIEDGAQLFSYYQQEQDTKFLCLYASDFIDGDVKYDYYLINVQDNTELLGNLKEPKTYKESKNNKQLFAAWKETYQQDVATRGLFEKDIAAYTIGKNKYSIADLKIVDNDAIQKKYHQFATILRQHNVSGHENAFDKLVNLFLAKVVDETNNPEELAFYWKGAAYDDFFRLQDRLQKLYKIGMERFLNEEVTYIDNADINEAFRLFKKDPDATRKSILEYFRQLKFFTNNDFAFIDVHNEHLFYQNAVVLKKIVQMLQDIKLKTETQNQFLGDLFEGFLDQGVKQSEGQFFTPMPIVKFLISSLPLESIVCQSVDIPKTIDYACGAGHFLNEYAQQIKPFVVKHKKSDLSSYYAAITGIEKEYRLSKVAKVSAFMYGQDEIRIIYADALAKNDEVQDGTYSVLVANPPYSVKGFLETLTETEREKYTLTKEVGDLTKNDSIETFFVERAAQLLKGGGVAAIILPSSILSNGNIYIKCREIILKYFDIVAISEFGSGTFGKTGTNTATLFLRRKYGNPDIAEHYKNRVNTWFAGDSSKDGVFDDICLLEKYCEHIGIAVDDYKTLLMTTPNGNLQKVEIFAEYRAAFENDTKAKNIKKKRITGKYTEADKIAELEKYILEAMRNAEKEKLYFFMLATSNPQQVLISKSPADNKAMKQFLGYEWSGAKGSEGIKYIGANLVDDDDDIAKNKGIKQIKTPLFDPNKLENEEKINTLIRKNFNGDSVQIHESLKEFVSRVNLVDMLDFSRVYFNKALRTSAVKKVEIQSKYPLVKLGEIAEVLKGKSITSAQIHKGNIKVVAGGLDYAYMHNIANRKANSITISASGANAGFVNFWREEIFASDCTTVRGKNDLHTIFIYNFLQSIQNQIYHLQKGSAQPHVYPDDIKALPVPNIDTKLQQQIVDECEKVDKEYNSSRMSIEEYKQKITQVFENLEVIIRSEGGGIFLMLSELCAFNPSKNNLKNIAGDTIVSFVEMASVSNDGFIENKIDRPLAELRQCGYTYFAENDIIIAKITPCMENGKCAVATGLTNGIGMGSSEFHVLRCNDKIINKFLFGFLNRDTIRSQAAKQMTGASGHRRVPVSFYEALRVPVPAITEQIKIVTEIETYETEIAKAKVVMNGCVERKKNILTNFLND